ncbi:DUF2946 domain-containing protein [Caballeronia grimmiae]|uniref:DUF2946 domain-containing protein n=1 Tax=Caballeronia grimmiae TaxID=1071679 RepID=UPI0038BDDA7D
MLSHFHRKIGGLLGLLAILMAMFAPTVSQILASTRGDVAMTGAHHPMSSMSSMSSMASMASMHDHALDGNSHHGSSMSDGQACGYCGLLAHMPVIPGVPATFAVTVRAIEHPVATRFESVRLVEPLTPAQPRAPPRFVLI